jgi:hypothetical protein
MKFTEDSINKTVRRIYGETAEVERVTEIFIPNKGWAPSLFNCRDGSLSIYLQRCWQQGWYKVQLKIRTEKSSHFCCTVLGAPYSLADFDVAELATS